MRTSFLQSGLAQGEPILPPPDVNLYVLIAFMFIALGLYLWKGLKDDDDCEPNKMPCYICNGSGIDKAKDLTRPCGWCDGSGMLDM